MSTDAEIEERIEMEITVDCYDEEEAAMGWFCYLDDRIEFPFQATSAKTRSRLTVTGMADTPGRLSHMYVKVNINGDELQLPLEKIEPINVSAETVQAIDDWKYWVREGYSF